MKIWDSVYICYSSVKYNLNQITVASVWNTGETGDIYSQFSRLSAAKGLGMRFSLVGPAKAKACKS